MDDVICFAPAHLEQVLGGFSGNRAKTADEDDVLGFEPREQNREEIAERIVEKDVKGDADPWRCRFQSNDCETRCKALSSLCITKQVYICLKRLKVKPPFSSYFTRKKRKI